MSADTEAADADSSSCRWPPGLHVVASDRPECLQTHSIPPAPPHGVNCPRGGLRIGARHDLPRLHPARLGRSRRSAVPGYLLALDRALGLVDPVLRSLPVPPIEPRVELPALRT